MAIDPKWQRSNNGSRGGKHRFSRRFIDDCVASWEEHGPAVLKQLRWRDIPAYANLMTKVFGYCFPKEVSIDVTRSTLLPEQRDAMIEALREHLAKIEHHDKEQKQLLIESRVENDCVAN